MEKIFLILLLVLIILIPIPSDPPTVRFHNYFEDWKDGPD